MKRGELEKRSRSVWQGAKYASVGIEFGVAVAVGYFAGDWIDGKMGWTPWGSIVGLMVGFGAGISTLVRVARAVQRSEEEEDADE